MVYSGIVVVDGGGGCSGDDGDGRGVDAVVVLSLVLRCCGIVSFVVTIKDESSRKYEQQAEAPETLLLIFSNGLPKASFVRPASKHGLTNSMSSGVLQPIDSEHHGMKNVCFHMEKERERACVANQRSSHERT